MYSIREAAIHVLQAVAKEFGPDWAREHIVLQVKQITSGHVHISFKPLSARLLTPSCGVQEKAPIIAIRCDKSVTSGMTLMRAAITQPNASFVAVQVLSLVNSDNYLHRMTVLAAIGALSTCVTREVVQMSMLPAVVACCKVRFLNLSFPCSKPALSRKLHALEQTCAGCRHRPSRIVVTFSLRLCASQLVYLGCSHAGVCLQDRTPNVRFNAAKVMQQLATVSDGPAIQHTIKPCLAELSADGDADVRFYAAAAAAACQ